MPRLDPFALPASFQAEDARADERVRQIELHHDRVIVRRHVREMHMKLSVPLDAFLGVALKLKLPAAPGPAKVAIVLEHSDPQLCVPLFADDDTLEVIAAWRSWGRVLRRPLLIAESDGELREAIPRLGAVTVASPACRRRKSTAVRTRRPSIFLRRKPGWAASTPPVHRDEREIIARN